MRTLALLVLPAISGCVVQMAGGPTFARHGDSGIAGELAVGDDSVRVLTQLSAQQLERRDGTGTAVAVDEGLRGSLPGALEPDADWARWLDFGADAGAGVGGHGDGPFARAWVGGWADVRLLPRHDEYPTLRAQIRAVAYSGNVPDETELFVGIGYVFRGSGGRVPD